MQTPEWLIEGLKVSAIGILGWLSREIWNRNFRTKEQKYGEVEHFDRMFKSAATVQEQLTTQLEKMVAERMEEMQTMYMDREVEHQREIKMYAQQLLKEREDNRVLREEIGELKKRIIDLEKKYG